MPELLLSPRLLGLLGLMIGSFLNVVILRKPVILDRAWFGDAAHYLQDADAMKRSIASDARQIDEFASIGRRMATALEALPPVGLSRPRSRCPHCGHQLAWHENIPLLSWVGLRGRCSACGKAVSARYAVVEALTGILFAAVAVKFGAQPACVVYCVAVAILIAAAFIDLDTTHLPDDLTLPLVGLGMVAAWQRWIPPTLADVALGVFFGYFSLWSLATLYKLVRGVEGMAEGDFRLLAGLGALLGWQALPSIILLSSVVGATVGIFLVLARGHGRNVPIPFGPYLAGGGVAALFFGSELSRLWPQL